MPATSMPAKQRNTSSSGGIRRKYRTGWINAASTSRQGFVNAPSNSGTDPFCLRLTATEWAIVEVLARNAGKLVTQRQFLEEVWHLRGNRTNHLRVFMVAVRRKLEPNPSRPKYFITEQGFGLRFTPEGRPARY
jgi:DNA-binding response OmpR family regulator